jgi:hypothetical protein
MPQLLYVRLFKGLARPIAFDGNVLEIAARARNCTYRSWIDETGPGWSIEEEQGEEAQFESQLVFTGATTYQQTGAIVFGSRNQRLTFSTIGSGHLYPELPAGVRRGAALWSIDGGEGMFGDATGIVASMIDLDDSGRVTDYQVGKIDVR